MLALSFRIVTALSRHGVMGNSAIVAATAETASAVWTVWAVR